MRAFVRFELPDGSHCELGHGDLVGRLWSAALQLDDARISEAHAMLSLRGETFRLLALRGRFAVAGKPSTSLILAPEMQIFLARELSIRVTDIELPTRVMGIEGPGLPRQVLNGVCSLVCQTRNELVPKYEANAAAHIWSDGQHWQLKVRETGERLELHDGVRFTLAGQEFCAVAIDLAAVGRNATRMLGGVQDSMSIVAQYDSVHLARSGQAPVALSGLGARLVSELVVFDGPVPWQVLAKEIWPDEDDSHLLRRRLDVNLARLRKKLREAGLRTDLVRADGLGHLELFLYEGDTVEDRT